MAKKKENPSATIIRLLPYANIFIISTTILYTVHSALA